LVYSAARRRLGGDAHSAADVTQQVFTALARQAPKLPVDVVLPAWLYATTRHLTANWVRAEQSRRAREQAAHHMDNMISPASAPEDWESVRPLLDTVIDELPEKDRCAILLRFFSRLSFAEIGAALQVNEDAARMRVARALEKLHAALARRGVASTAAALGGVLTQNAVTAAPAGMAAAVAGAAFQSEGLIAGLFLFMSSHKLSLGLAAAVVIIGAAGFASLSRVESAPSPLPPSVPPTAQKSPPAQVGSTAPSAPSVELLGTEHRVTSASAAAAAKPAPAGPAATLVARRVDRLDALVHLSAEQKTRAAEIFARENAILESIPMEERGEKGQEARVASRNDVRSLLTPEQRQKYNVSPQSAGGGLGFNPEALVSRLHQTVNLTPEQQQKATQIFWEDTIDQAAALPADQYLEGYRWRDQARARLRAILTPQQQATFDQTPPYGRNR
jgi:RNA polymerase sigma factor (sigma-70 family)